jgi:hypothetical protein
MSGQNHYTVRITAASISLFGRLSNDTCFGAYITEIGLYCIARHPKKAKKKAKPEDFAFLLPVAPAGNKHYTCWLSSGKTVTAYAEPVAVIASLVI